jgi:hypothetical protein
MSSKSAKRMAVASTLIVAGSIAYTASSPRQSISAPEITQGTSINMLRRTDPTEQCMSRTNLNEVEKMLTPQQLKNYLGIGSPEPSDPKVYVAWRGWQGPGVYDFEASGCKTSYIDDVQKLNNYAYVFGREPRQAVHGEAGVGKLQPVTPQLKEAVDKCKLITPPPNAPHRFENIQHPNYKLVGNSFPARIVLGEITFLQSHPSIEKAIVKYFTGK